MLLFLSNPGAKHLDGVRVALCSLWDDEWFHKQV
jgi:hypothetical protein